MDSIDSKLTYDANKIKSDQVKISLFNNNINSKESAYVLYQPYKVIKKPDRIMDRTKQVPRKKETAITI